MLKKNSIFLRLILVIFLILGISLSITFGSSLKKRAEESWFTKAVATAEQATGSCIAMFARQQTQLRGIASLFYGSAPVNKKTFLEVIDLIETTDSLPFHSVAYGIRDDSSKKLQYIVSLSSLGGSLFPPGKDIAQNEQIVTALTAADNFPGDVVMSRSFTDDDGNRMACLLLTIRTAGTEGVLIAAINVSDILNHHNSFTIPEGLHLQSIFLTPLGDGYPRQTEFFQAAESLPNPVQQFHTRMNSGKNYLDYLWTLTAQFSGGPALQLGQLVQVAGSVFALLLFIVLWFLLKENERVQEKVGKRTAELQATSEQLKALSEASFEAILLSKNGLCVDMNTTAVKMFGYSRDEAIGSPATIIFSPEQLKRVMKKIQAEVTTPYEAVITKKDGSTFPVLVQGRTIDYLGAKVRVTAMSDISIRKDAEKEKEKLTEQLHQAKKMESIGLMAGGVAHDLNNILSGIIGYPELLLQSLPEDSPLQKPIEAIRESGQRAATVVADLLTVARSAATTREAHDLNALIRQYMNSPECKTLRSRHPQVSYTHHFEAKDSTILCSSVHVKKCLMNLTLNAAEAINGEGSIRISTSNQTIDDAKSREQDIAAGNYVILSVQDTGSGISEEDLKHIFEPFYTKKEMGKSGTGLGLTVVWNTMEDHNGKVSATSSSNGTCFELFFPVSSEAIPTETKNTLPEPDENGNESILIVDDEPHLRDIGSKILQDAGYIVYSVSSGEHALEFVKQTPVDLLILDMLMRPGMSGYQTYQQILQVVPDQKAIIVSGFSESEDVQKTLALGAGNFIKKPYSMEQLKRAVRKTLNG